jgi:hypothetical protein
MPKCRQFGIRQRDAVFGAGAPNTNKLEVS